MTSRPKKKTTKNLFGSFQDSNESDFTESIVIGDDEDDLSYSLL